VQRQRREPRALQHPGPDVHHDVEIVYIMWSFIGSRLQSGKIVEDLGGPKPSTVQFLHDTTVQTVRV
jgi:hypothetical protein